MALYDQMTLAQVMRVQKTSAPAFWQSFFPTVIAFDTPKIAFDKVFSDDRRLAPFVIPTKSGRPQALSGYDTWSFQPAYVKLKDVVHAQMHIERLPGETLGAGSLSIGQRRDAAIAELLRMQKVRFANRNEWLSARAIIDAKVTISGEDYPTTLVDFRRHASLTGVLAGAAKWDQATGDPMADLKTMRQNVMEQSGVRITKHVFGADAWDLFTQRVDLKELQNTLYGGTDVKVTRIWDGFGDTMEYMGRIAGLNGAGAIEIWVNTARFIDPEDGVLKYYLDQNTVVGVSDSLGGVRCFGAIMDAAAGYQALEVFNKNWIENDPSVEYLLGQSAPLMVPRNPDAGYSLKVA